MKTRIIELEFLIKDNVKILPIEKNGIVKGMLFDETGIQYYIRYFINGESKQSYFYREELEFLSEEIAKQLKRSADYSLLKGRKNELN